MAYPAQKYTMEIPDENCVDPGGDSDFTPTGTSPSLADPTLNRYLLTFFPLLQVPLIISFPYLLLSFL